MYNLIPSELNHLFDVFKLIWIYNFQYTEFVLRLVGLFVLVSNSFEFVILSSINMPFLNTFSWLENDVSYRWNVICMFFSFFLTEDVFIAELCIKSYAF